MRVAYLAAGAGNMYCGSCLRDNRVVATLCAQGRDVVLLPLYSPLRTDERDVSRRPVHYGGINVYLQQKSAVFRQTPPSLDRVLDSPVLLRQAMRLAGGTAPEALGALTVSLLRGEQGAQRKELAKLVRTLRELRPALVNLPNAMFVGIARRLKEALGVPVLCTLGGEDIFLDKLPEPSRAEAEELIRRGVGNIDGFIAVSRYYAGVAAERFAVPQGRLHVVPLGICLEGFTTPPERPAEPFVIGYLARICHDKGLHLLCQAFAILRREGRGVRLRIAGTLPPQDRSYWQELHARLTRDGLSAHVEYAGEVDRAGKIRFLNSIHVLSVPTVYREAKGLYVLEALAVGVPVVQPEHGSFPELIAATGGGLLCRPGDPQELARCLARLIDEPELRVRLGRQGRQAVHERFTDTMMAEKTWEIYEQYAGRQTAST